MLILFALIIETSHNTLRFQGLQRKSKKHTGP